MNIYGIYDIKQNEQCLRVGTLQEIIKFSNLSVREIGLALKNRKIIRTRYQICYLFKEV